MATCEVASSVRLEALCKPYSWPPGGPDHLLHCRNDAIRTAADALDHPPQRCPVAGVD